MNKYQEAKGNIVNTLARQIGFESFKNLYEKDFETLKELIVKQEKYRWHDLRKDPNDLPEDKIVNICYETKGYTYSTAIYVRGRWVLCREDIDLCNEVIAWKYIERFEDE